MVGEMRRLLGTASLMALLASASTGLAQTGRPWVDPPAESAPSPHASAPPASQPAPRAQPDQPKLAPSDQPASSAAEDATLEQKETRKSTASTQAAPPRAAATRKSVARGGPSKPGRVAERKPRSPTREATVARREPQRMMANSQGPRGVSYRNAQEGIAAGLELMRMRTIEFPDGRRITILTKPGRETLSELGPPY